MKIRITELYHFIATRMATLKKLQIIINIGEEVENVGEALKKHDPTVYSPLCSLTASA